MKITDSKSLGQSIQRAKEKNWVIHRNIFPSIRLKYYFHFTVGAGKADGRNRENNTAYSYPWNGSDDRKEMTKNRISL